MLDKIKISLESIIAIIINIGILWGLLIPIGVGLASFLSTGNPLSYFYSIPLYIWAIIAFLVIIVFIYYFFIKKEKTKDHYGLAIGIALEYLEIVCEYNHVKWKVSIPNNRGQLSDQHIIVHTPPMCPKCMSDLEERTPKIGKRNWTCPAGDFKIKSKDSFFTTAETLKKIVKGEVRQNIYNK